MSQNIDRSGIPYDLVLAELGAYDTGLESLNLMHSYLVKQTTEG